MPNLLEGLLQGTGQASGGSDNAFSLQDLLESQLGGYYKGADKAMKEMGEQQVTEALQQGVPATEIMAGLIKMAKPKSALQQGSVSQDQQGNINIQKEGWGRQVLQNILPAFFGTNDVNKGLEQLQTGSQIQQNQGNRRLTPEQQISTLTRTQDMLKKLGIKAKVDVTATGVPSLSTQPELGLSDLSPEQQVQAVSLARKVAGVRGADRLIPSITENLKAGKTIDQIEDELRLSGQSSEFSGSLRSAAQQITVGKTANEQQTAFDTLDDLQGDTEQQKEYLKRMAVVNAPVDQRQQVMGKERTIGLLDEIGGDLDTLEKNGVPTGFLRGNYEGLMGRIGKIGSPDMRRVATKVAVAVINYRRAMTGVQFGQIENQEYKKLFPNIDKIGDFNKQSIQGLKEVFSGDVDTFYSQSMGKKNYKELFNEKGFDFSNMSTEQLKNRLQELKGGGK